MHRERSREEVIEDEDVTVAQIAEEPQISRVRRLVGSQPVSQIIEPLIGNGAVLPAGSVDQDLGQLALADTRLAEDDHARQARLRTAIAHLAELNFHREADTQGWSKPSRMNTSLFTRRPSLWRHELQSQLNLHQSSSTFS